MATVAGTVKGISLLKEDPSSETLKVALVTFTMGAYTAASDNGELTAIGAAIAAQRRDGKTVTLIDGMCAGRGKQGSTEFESRTWAVSSDALTFNVTNTSGSEVDAASGISDRPMQALVCYRHA